MKLFKTTVEMTLYVVADDEDEACDIAAHSFSMEDPDAASCYALEARSITDGWEGCIPYGDSDYRTCEQWLCE